MVQIVGVLCKNAPSIHALGQRLRPKTPPITAFPYTSGSVSKLFVSSFAHQWMRPIESLLVNKRMGRGSSWSSLDLETLESDVSSGKSAGSIAKDRGWPSSSVHQRVAALKRGDPAPRYVGGSPRRLTPELLDEIREFIEDQHGDKLHLTSHHPIRAQNFTTKSHSTAQVPCSCLGSTCSDVSSRPPCV